jgi:eukaryotic-like serine/threonine-protein kinase
MIGRTVSHYRIVSKLGEGGMGVVYKAEDTKLQRTVALKFLPAHAVEDDRKQRFLQEARNAARLQHPNICPIYEVDEVDDQLFFSMAYLEGPTLARHVAGRGLPVHEALDIAIQIASGLEEAHQRGIVHRDIKSGNIIIGLHGHPYILDFGLAISADDIRLTEEGHTVGTPGYMSPEQASGQVVDSRTDVWSLGVLLFEMLTGRRPFVRDQRLAVIHAILNDAPPSLHTLRSEVTPDLQFCVEKALNKNPDLRWQSAREFASELQLIRDGQVSHPTMSMLVSTVGTTAIAAPVPAKSRRFLLAAIAGVPIAGAAAWYGWNSRTIAPAVPDQKHIAVLPFEVIGHDPGLQAIVDGLVEVLTARLTQIEFPGKTMVVPASEIRSRKITSAAQAMQLYGANLVIAGSAQLIRQTVQFTVTLVDPATMRQLGARTFDTDSVNPISLRDSALTEILGLLQVQFSRSDRKKANRGETDNPGAYADYLKATGYISRYDKPGNIDLALTNFQNAIQKDPRYALAYSGMAVACLRKLDLTNDKQWAEQAIKNAERATQLQPDLPETHTKLGAVYGYVGREVEAIREFQKSLQLSPGNGEVYRDLAPVLENQGRFTEAEAMYTESIAKRPDDWYGLLLFALFLERRHRYQEAEPLFRRAIELTPNNPIAYRVLGGSYRIQGRYPEAADQLQKALTIEPVASVYNALGFTLYYQHRFPEAAAAIEKALDSDPARYVFWGNLGMIYKEIPGKETEAVRALNRAIEFGNKLSVSTPKNYILRADLAEYHARLGQAQPAIEQLEVIPSAVRERYLTRFALVYELIGQRGKAVACLLELPEPTQLNEVKDDPSLKKLWADPELQAKLRAKWKDFKF